jgi:hypothetical protein
MEYFKELIIQDLQEEDFQLIKDVSIEKFISFNEGGNPVRAGQGHVLIGFVGGENKDIITCKGIANEIRESFLPKKVNISFIDPGLQVTISNASIQRKGGDIIIEGGDIVRTITNR